MVRLLNIIIKLMSWSNRLLNIAVKQTRIIVKLTSHSKTNECNSQTVWVKLTSHSQTSEHQTNSTVKLPDVIVRLLNITVKQTRAVGRQNDFSLCRNSDHCATAFWSFWQQKTRGTESSIKHGVTGPWPFSVFIEWILRVATSRLAPARRVHFVINHYIQVSRAPRLPRDF